MRGMLPAQTTNGADRHIHGSVVSFVGCKPDGQAGPLEAPKCSSRVLPIDKEKAQRLAYYKATRSIGLNLMYGPLAHLPHCG